MGARKSSPRSCPRAKGSKVTGPGGLHARCHRGSVVKKMRQRGAGRGEAFLKSEREADERLLPTYGRRARRGPGARLPSPSPASSSTTTRYRRRAVITEGGATAAESIGGRRRMQEGPTAPSAPWGERCAAPGICNYHNSASNDAQACGPAHPLPVIRIPSVNMATSGQEEGDGGIPPRRRPRPPRTWHIDL